MTLEFVGNEALTSERVSVINSRDKAIVASPSKIIACRKAGVVIPLAVQPQSGTLRLSPSPKAMLHPGRPYAGDGDLCLCVGGHRGDILNVAPIAHYWAKRGLKVYMSVPQEFEDLLERMPYVTPFCPMVNRCVVVSTLEAARQASFPLVLVGHRLGPRRCAHWNEEAWDSCGMLNHIHDPAFPLVLSCGECPPELAGKVIVNLTAATTVPFRAGASVLDRLRCEFGDALLDVGSLTFANFVDLLPVMKSARCIVSVDTGTAHLAVAAHPVPLVHLVAEDSANDPWGASNPRFGRRVTYREAASPDIVVNAVLDSMR